MQDTVDMDAAFDRLRDEVIVPAFEQAANDMIEDMREMLSIPVEYVSGPRGGTYVIRSQRGESPRRETGTLQASIQEQIALTPTGVWMIIFSDVIYSLYLEDDLNRPHWSRLLEMWLERLPTRLAIVLRF